MPVKTELDAPVCRSMKTKMLYVLGPEAVDLTVPSSTAHYWCVQTMRTIGPDDQLVTPDQCCAGRGCFEPSD